jgi:TonB family protein
MTCLAAAVLLAAAWPRLEVEVEPVYPNPAWEARIQGEVKFTALIAPDGSVAALRLISGHPLLVNAAMKAAKQWRYAPPGEYVATPIVVKFSLKKWRSRPESLPRLKPASRARPNMVYDTVVF